MTKSILQFVVALIGCTLFISCKKEAAQKKIERVVYSIRSDQLKYITIIIYSDENGKAITLSSAGQSSTEWTTDIFPSQKPFTAKMSVTVINSSSVPIQFILVISVSGTDVKSQSMLALPSATITKEIEDTIY